MPEDDRAVMERLAALEAEVKADADAQRARKEAALAKVREQRAQQLAERDQLRNRQAALVSKKAKPAVEESDEEDAEPGIGSALDLAVRANQVKQELVRKPKAGEKSLVRAGIASMALGPLGWLYAGSFREAIPASAAWLALVFILSKLPTLLLMPALFVALPLSGIVGAVYASRYNKTGKRQRLFGKKKPPKQLPGR